MLAVKYVLRTYFTASNRNLELPVLYVLLATDFSNEFVVRLVSRLRLNCGCLRILSMLSLICSLLVSNNMNRLVFPRHSLHV